MYKEILRHISQHTGVPKPNQLHADIFHIFFVNSRNNLEIIMKCWVWTDYFSNLTGSFVSNGNSPHSLATYFQF